MTNIFGNDVMYEEKDLVGKIYMICTACTSLFSEFLSFANKYPERITKNPAEADSIIVISCQVTDLSVYNDLMTMKSLMQKYPGKNYFIGGCLALRFDIAMLEGVNRVENLRVDYQPLDDMTLIDYQAPYWVENFKEDMPEHADGQLFRHSYPLRIGVGCSLNCSYCTIRVTRGKLYTIDPKLAEDEFENHDNIVLISDSPTYAQINDWMQLALAHDKKISIRNIEPHVAMQSFGHLTKLADKGLLKELHCPVQHTNIDVLKDMRRNVQATLVYMKEVPRLKESGVFLATNVITDYKHFPNPDMKLLNSIFDYVVWNPYWDGKFDMKVAEERFYKYFPWKKGVAA